MSQFFSRRGARRALPRLPCHVHLQSSTAPPWCHSESIQPIHPRGQTPKAYGDRRPKPKNQAAMMAFRAACWPIACAQQLRRVSSLGRQLSPIWPKRIVCASIGYTHFVARCPSKRLTVNTPSQKVMRSTRITGRAVSLLRRSSFLRLLLRLLLGSEEAGEKVAYAMEEAVGGRL